MNCHCAIHGPIDCGGECPMCEIERRDPERGLFWVKYLEDGSRVEIPVGDVGREVD